MTAEKSDRGGHIEQRIQSDRLKRERGGERERVRKTDRERDRETRPLAKSFLCDYMFNLLHISEMVCYDRANLC